MPDGSQPLLLKCDFPTCRGAIMRTVSRRVAELGSLLPALAHHLDPAGADILAFTAFPKAAWRQIWSNNPVRHEAPRHRGEVRRLPRWVVAAA